ncbi:MAG: LysE family translocator [Rhizobiaceae bacterium]|nr:LysE family translocator [Rhizobiaceae bacterium]|tara:strand:- start:81752 stop:82342 length:591 start_codon:yes stop_codon:yes gene_type:complete
MLTFAIACCLLLITPGPGVLTAAGVGSGYGYRHGIFYIAGLFVGSNLVGLAVVTGLAAIILADPAIRTVLLWASTAYLLYLAYRIAFSGTKVAFIGAPKPPGFMGGVLLQAINPKAYTVNTALFTGFQIWPDALQAEVLVKFAIINVIWIPVHLLWLAAGVSLHRLDLAPRTQFIINILMALAMLGVVALAAWREF